MGLAAHQPPYPAAPQEAWQPSPRSRPPPLAPHLTCCFPQPPGRTHPPLCPFFQDPLISRFLQEAFQVPLGPSACPASDLPEREQPRWGLPAGPPSLAAGELLGLPVGPLCPGPSWTWCSGTCVQRDSLGHASILGAEAEHPRGCRPRTLGLCLCWKASTFLT